MHGVTHEADVGVDGRFLHGHELSDIHVYMKLTACDLSHCFITLPSNNYISIWYASFVIKETAYQPSVTGEWFLKNSNNVAKTVS